MTKAAISGHDVSQDSGAARGQGAARRAVLRGAGLAGAGLAVAGCSTAAVPYGANDAGQAPGAAGATASALPSPSAPAPAGRRPKGTLLGQASAIPVGGGMVFAAAKVVVTQPAKGVFKAFSAVCTHVGCLCDQVADGTINCPCHGSRFTITNGAVVAGPAPAALPAAAINVADGMITLA